ncbi:unnamed protein product [Vitrella brassicaformis CCMP3155]|uniref:EGF-like domain-containing protein n=2 Tax=Vitrella brassicaformis TaxID=1169539 RepID=A0A0G4F841_VITBC|nr:unnamed protein product [Vitrella brassicaformis CCMP3155]|eukprot:CEM08134.1 unnamed protein product [Vitrella brassicaformis CCMP3155]
MSSNNFSGPLPPSLGNAGKLWGVWLNENSLSGALPSTLSGWKSVQYLYINNNNFSGTLKPLSNLTSLRALWVANNSFEGHLPVGFQTLKNLTEIHAAENRLISFSDYDYIIGFDYSGAGYESLRHLDLSFNHIEWSIDLSIFPNLEYADLSNNLITGFARNGRNTIPQSLKVLHLEHNLLTALPEGFRSMPNLETLHLANNHISQWPKWGSTPSGFCDNDHLTAAASEGNILNVLRSLLNSTYFPLPPDWGSLTHLDVSNNPIAVDATEFFMPLKWQDNLQVLEASNCELDGLLGCEASFVFDRAALEEEKTILEQASSTSSTIDWWHLFWPMPNLGKISLSDNNITAIDTTETWKAWESSMYHLDLRNNSLRRVTSYPDLFESIDNLKLAQNPDLKREQTAACISLTAIEKCQDLRRDLNLTHKNFSWCPDKETYELRPLVPDPLGYSARRSDNGEERFECTEFCAAWNQVEVDYTFDSDALCRCLPGYEGTGINCTMCPAGTYSNRQVGTQTCKQCPDDAGSHEGSAACYCRLGYERGNEPCEPCTAGSVGVRMGGDGSESLETWTCRDCLPGLNCSLPVNYNASVLPSFFQLTVQLQSDGLSHNATREVTT